MIIASLKLSFVFLESRLFCFLKIYSMCWNSFGLYPGYHQLNCMCYRGFRLCLVSQKNVLLLSIPLVVGISSNTGSINFSWAA